MDDSENNEGKQMKRKKYKYRAANYGWYSLTCYNTDAYELNRAEAGMPISAIGSLSSNRTYGEGDGSNSSFDDSFVHGRRRI